MTSTKDGQEAERLVAMHLESLGHRIVARNWRTRWCEIDIVSIFRDVVYFTEVKYRSSQSWGTGLEYITEKKLKQMRFAAEFWMAEHSWRSSAMLYGAEVDSESSVRLVEID